MHNCCLDTTGSLRVDPTSVFVALTLRLSQIVVISGNSLDWKAGSWGRAVGGTQLTVVAQSSILRPPNVRCQLPCWLHRDQDTTTLAIDISWPPMPKAGTPVNLTADLVGYLFVCCASYLNKSPAFGHDGPICDNVRLKIRLSGVAMFLYRLLTSCARIATRDEKITTGWHILGIICARNRLFLQYSTLY